MNTLAGKKIILGITGSIAAYKAAFFVRLLIKKGADVKVIMTQSATTFISPLTLSTLSKNPVITGIADGDEWSNHVELGLWADALIIAPATANTLAKMANGICDNILNAVYLSARCPVFIAPGMDLDMWTHPSTQANIQKLISFNNILIEPESGELASGLIGKGRMAEPENILTFLSNFFRKEHLSLAGKTVLITAGPTYEPIDPVRFIGNHSSGKMGKALAEKVVARGGQVKLILGPSKLNIAQAGIEVFRITTALEMLDAAKKHFAQADIAIMAAAVADFRPKNVATEKIKKKANQDEMNIELVKNPDIAATLGKMKTDKQILIGFALETEQPVANATRKLNKKGFDFIVLNSLKDKGAGFNHDTNRITLVFKDNKTQEFQLKSKLDVADDILDAIEQVTKEKK